MVRVGGLDGEVFFAWGDGWTSLERVGLGRGFVMMI